MIFLGQFFFISLELFFFLSVNSTNFAGKHILDFLYLKIEKKLKIGSFIFSSVNSTSFPNFFGKKKTPHP